MVFNVFRSLHFAWLTRVIAVLVTYVFEHFWNVTRLLSIAEAYLEPSQTYKVEVLPKNDSWLKAVFAESSILDV